MQNLCLFIAGDDFAAEPWQVISMCSWFMVATVNKFSGVYRADAWTCANRNLLIDRSNPREQNSLFSRLFCRYFHFSFYS